ncbi:MAG TPA: prolyl oligopeptidase family serine peptidase [Steroidobacteraceae bacterium]|nr:prolyl oligopeptidase family serine peptidase [Steroidobacteraceae bacterium]
MPDWVRPAARGRAWPWIRALLPLGVAALVAGCAPLAAREAAPAAAARAFGAYPATRRVEQIDRYHDVAVADPYRWLEALESPEVHDWVGAENAVSSPYLEALPARAVFKERLAAMWNYERWGASLTGGNSFSAPRRRNGRLFYLHNSGREDQSVLLVEDGADAAPRVLLDPNTLAADRTVALVDYQVSADARYLAYATSDGGSDWHTIHVREVAGAKDLPETLELVKATPLAWAPDSRGLYYSRYPVLEDNRGDDSKQVSIWYHTLGTPQASDRFVYAISDHPTRNPYGTVTDDGRYLVIEVRDGFATNGVYLLDLAARDADAIRLLDRFDARYEFLGSRGEEFYFATTEGAPHGRIVAVDLGAPDPEHWRTLVAEAAETIDSAHYVAGHFVVAYLRDAHSLLRVYDADGGAATEVALPGLGQIAGLSGEATDSEAWFAYTDFLTPHAVYRYEVASGRLELYRRPAVALDPAVYVTEQVTYTSKDGTHVPMYLTHRRDVARDGRRPTLLYGYGGFNLPMLPVFSVPVAVWLEQGGIYAVANLRGGSEFGASWHLAGTRTRKQNVFDDFIAAAEWLVKSGYTSREHLAIRGRSNGGLLVGAVLLQRPDLFAAALPAVGVLDMLRYQTASANARQWSSDYGLADDPEEFRALLAYSPVHNVRAGVCYPPTLITTAERDDRVVPWHSYKFAAALQAAEPATCQSPLLLRVETRAGHGNDRPTWMQVEDYAEQWAFLAWHLGLAVRVP